MNGAAVAGNADGLTLTIELIDPLRSSAPR